VRMERRAPAFETLCPPSLEGPALLQDRVARRAAARLARVRSRLARAPLARDVPEAGAVLAAVAEALRRLSNDARRRALAGPDVRGFLAEAECWIAIRRLGARRGARRSDPRVAARLFDHVCRTEFLPTLVPAGRLDRGFAGRCARFARRRLRQIVRDLAALVLGLRLAGPPGPPLRLRLEGRAEPEMGRPGSRIDLGTYAGPAGPLALVPAAVRRPRPRAGRDRFPAAVRARLSGGILFARRGEGRETAFPAAGSRLRYPEAGGPDGARRSAGGRPILLRRRVVPGTSIVLAPGVISSRRRLAVGAPIAGLEKRLALALRVVQVAWPEGHREILRRTALVVPVREPGLVSYSLASRPGVSFINVAGKTTLDLADDLLHETAHHLLHDLQETARLLRAGPDTEEIQAFVSPWRGVPRPLHGILHGTYTFLFRAELFSRLLFARGGRRRMVRSHLRRGDAARLRREWRRECGLVARGLADLARAGRAGLLTADGRALVRGMRNWYSRLASNRGGRHAQG